MPQDCNVKVTYDLSPQVKGKMEQPYGWLRDHLIRTCVREYVNDIKPAQQIPGQEIPYIRFQRTLKQRPSLFREFKITPPFQSPKDIFCLRMNRTVDAYRRISVNHPQFKVHADPYQQVNLRIYPINDQLYEIRLWSEGKLIDTHKAKSSDLEGMHF